MKDAKVVEGITDKIKELEEIENQKGKRLFKSLFFKELRNCEKNPVVFSRYSTGRYDPNEKPPEKLPMSCIINIRALLSEQQCNKDYLIPYVDKSTKLLTNKIESYYTPENEEDKTLVFESRFESGNLSLAIKMSDNEYNLLLQNDINTKGHTQWFYFRVSNTKKGHTVKFNILNLAKPDSLYNYGMKVLCLSETLK